MASSAPPARQWAGTLPVQRWQASCHVLPNAAVRDAPCRTIYHQGRWLAPCKAGGHPARHRRCFVQPPDVQRAAERQAEGAPAAADALDGAPAVGWHNRCRDRSGNICLMSRHKCAMYGRHNIPGMVGAHLEPMRMPCAATASRSGSLLSTAANRSSGRSFSPSGAAAGASEAALRSDIWDCRGQAGQRAAWR